MRTTKYLLVVIVFFVFKTTYGQDGTLDTTFNGSGILLNYDSLESENLFLRVQPDGRIITSETVSGPGVNPQYYIRKYDSSGFHDTTFGVGGIVQSNFSGLSARISGMDLQSDGKILIAGNLSNAFFARYDADGVLDPTFGVNGLATAEDYLQSYALQSDGKILACSTGSINKLSRYNSSGVIDSSFGVGGSIELASSGKLRVQTDDKILMTSENGDFTITRYLIDGAIDTTFGIAGSATFHIDDYSYVSSLKEQADGKVLFSGRSRMDITYTFTYRLIKLLSNGVLDPSFGTNGMVLLTTNPEEMELQPDGKIIVLGTLSMEMGATQLALSRYLANGDLDMSFGASGFAYASMGVETRVYPNAVEVSADGKIVVGGIFCESEASCHRHSFMARFNFVSLATLDFATNKNAFTVYPNPVNQIVNLDFNLPESEILSMDLFDINGRKISNLLNNGNFQIGNNSQKLELPESLSRGIYFLNISDGKNTSMVKIIK